MVINRLVYYGSQTGKDIRAAFIDDLTNGALIHESLKSLVSLQDDVRLEIEVRKMSDDHWRVDTNLASILNINENQTHRLVERALLNLAGLEHRLYEMRDFDSLVGFHSDNEFNLFKQKVRTVADMANQNKINENFARIIELSGLPDFDEILQSGRFNFDKLIKIRESRECKEFRTWLWSLNNSTDDEIKVRLSSLNSKAGNFFNTTLGKTIRLGATTLAGIVPPAGLALSAIDSFLLDKVFKQDGATAFINSIYPSLYEG